ncbi:hypothetical protein FS749_000737 [Ceratobasidium sp. UAMH 11750]|nr:hypothetical protein FS749_000737 [Ceratobasidium sp. UAMH 11750]
MYSEEALELFLKTARLQGGQMSENERKTAVKLLQEFGHLALAIVPAGAYIWTSKRTIAQYHDMFLSQRQKTLEKYQELSIKVGDYQESVYTTWHMSYVLLGRHAQQLLWLMAFMHHDNLTGELFRRAALNIQTYEFPTPPSDAEIGVHTYVKDVLQQYLDSSDSWDSSTFLSVMTELLSYSLITYDQVNATYSLHVLVHDWASTVVPHLRAVAIKHTTLLLAVSVDDGDSAAEYAYKRGLETHVNAVLQRQKKPGPNNMLALAKVYRCVGKWAQVEKMEQAGLEACRRAFGDEHPNTVTCSNNLALVYLQLGRYEDARKLQVRALDACKQIWGDEHTSTAISMGYLALAYRYLGQYKKAKTLQLRALAVSTRISSDQHSDTLNIMHYLALTYCDLGRYQDAAALQERIMKAQERASCAEHPNTLDSMQSLAQTYRRLGRYKDTKELQERILKAREQMFGDEHPSTLASMQNLALTYRDLGQYQAAVERQVHILKARKRLSGDDHPDTLTSMLNLALTYCDLGRYNEAEKLQELVM